ncbi:MAG TPA: peptidylprolyl isomerase [bacterium]|nr:peptidylprolyl isomerase [bacterium]
MRPWALTLLFTLALSALGCPAPPPANKTAEPADKTSAAAPVAEGELTPGAIEARNRQADGEALMDAAEEAGKGPAEGIDAPPPPPEPEAPDTTSQPEPAALTRDTVKIDDQVAIMKTTKGDIYVFFYPNEAPKHVANFIYLASKDVYKDSFFHRVIPDFVIQGGEIRNPDYKEPEVMIPNEATSKRIHIPGALAAARTQDPNSATSQFYFAITRERTSALDNPESPYTVYGQTFRGMNVINAIAGDQKNSDQNPQNQNADKDATNNDRIVSVQIVDAAKYADEIAKYKKDHAIED